MTGNAILEMNSQDIVIGNYNYIDSLINNKECNSYARCMHCAFPLNVHEWATNDDCSVQLELRKIFTQTDAFTNLDTCDFYDADNKNAYCGPASQFNVINYEDEPFNIRCCDNHIVAMVTAFGIANVSEVK